MNVVDVSELLKHLKITTKIFRKYSFQNHIIAPHMLCAPLTKALEEVLN